ncbi:hypothetical protein OAF98_05590 [Planctomicrobium sp.]|jgi:hypothetical protein|nr:hypothetical protein [Planctomicrobium sp.]MBT5021021.1 hypothetical protein [Planctomicrobium sp.]MDB4731194.1 hypothetical protein [bacterium]MDB4733394.1 hypothetical protein [Planctomicrobium sp.]MDB4743940.1 hypothetical protein [Planctomicrobium sp.]
MDDDGPHIVFAIGIAVMAATAAWSYGFSREVGFLIGIHLAGIYDFLGRLKIMDSVVELFLTPKGAAIDKFPVWFGVIFIDIFLIGSHYRWF